MVDTYYSMSFYLEEIKVVSYKLKDFKMLTDTRRNNIK